MAAAQRTRPFEMKPFLCRGGNRTVRATHQDLGTSSVGNRVLARTGGIPCPKGTITASAPLFKTICERVAIEGVTYMISDC
jgi:hypothetical protein